MSQAWSSEPLDVWLRKVICRRLRAKTGPRSEGIVTLSFRKSSESHVNSPEMRRKLARRTFGPCSSHTAEPNLRSLPILEVRIASKYGALNLMITVKKAVYPIITKVQ